MAEFTQEQLEVMIEGKSPNPNVVFYESARIDVAASKEAGRRVYKTQTFVKKTQPGVTDWASHVAQPQDIKDYPDEYAYFMGNKQGDRMPSIEIIPGLGIIHMQELIDLGLLNIKALAEANVIPPHLQYAQVKAIRIYSAMKDDYDSQESQESQRRETRSTEPEKEALVPRRLDHGNVAIPERCNGPETGNQSSGGENPKGFHQSGQVHSGQVSKGVDSNWSASFVVG